jgi:hypothetical protein
MRSTQFVWTMAALFLLGCGGGAAPFGVVPVKGKVTYDDGTVISASKLQVNFISQTPPKGKEHPRPGAAAVNVADGSFPYVTTWDPMDGAVTGKHKVTVQAYDAMEQISAAVPAEYGDPAKTPLEVEVKSGMAPLELKVKKPSK